MIKSKSVPEVMEIYNNNVRLAEHTIKNYTFYLNKFITFLSLEMNSKPHEIYLDEIYILKDTTGRTLRYLPIDSQIIDDYFYSLVSNNKSYNVLKDNYKSLMSLFKFLENNFNLDNPLINIRFRLKDYSPQKGTPKSLTRGNIIKFLNSVITYSEDLATEILLFTVMFSTGCRPSEILNIKCQDIDFENKSFRLIETKNKQQRIVFLRPGMEKEIQKYIEKRCRKDTDYLFLKDNQKKMTTENVNVLLEKYLQKANLPIITSHGTRHTFANLMADQGTPIDIIRQLLGHESLHATKMYINPHYVRNKDIVMPENQIVINYLKDKL